ncbi:hypothetical protein BJ508DRAFT_310860 [Ascobolus immersus RN42]|uniref:Uncharacterized protein n=1 Tax=Ascobolus immersus RN42 TaxID=1160509 RepID=A0A3N4HTN0_ASCIM|nr:hypothetical protein BJ508DRAFT_310860 [Ascobolus immersus RN42]
MRLRTGAHTNTAEQKEDTYGAALEHYESPSVPVITVPLQAISPALSASEAKFKDFETQLHDFNARLGSFGVQLESHHTELLSFKTQLEAFGTQLRSHQKQLESHGDQLKDFKLAMDEFGTVAQRFDALEGEQENSNDFIKHHDHNTLFCFSLILHTLARVAGHTSYSDVKRANGGPRAAAMYLEGYFARTMDNPFVLPYGYILKVQNRQEFIRYVSGTGPGAFAPENWIGYGGQKQVPYLSTEAPQENARGMEERKAAEAHEYASVVFEREYDGPLIYGIPLEKQTKDRREGDVVE